MATPSVSTDRSCWLSRTFRCAAGTTWKTLWPPQLLPASPARRSPGLPPPCAVFPAWSIVWSASSRSTASPGTTTRKPPTSTRALKAIDAFAGDLWIILGGKDKGSDYGPLREPLRAKAHAALLIGAAADKIAGQLSGAVPLVPCGSLDRAIHYARGHSSAGDVVLLAPACASFDQFDNFEHRGRVFKEIVERIALES